MGGRISRDRSWPHSSSVRSNSSSWGQYDSPQSPNRQDNRSYAPSPSPAYPAYPPQQYSQPSQNYGGRPRERQRNLDRRYSRIADNYNSLEERTVREQPGEHQARKHSVKSITTIPTPSASSDGVSAGRRWKRLATCDLRCI
ncbi:RING-type E3 ubiquitin transferase [Sarracenia purpurea var. burkii]